MPSKGRGNDAKKDYEIDDEDQADAGFDLAKPKVYRNDNVSNVASLHDLDNETVKLQQQMRAKRFGIVEKPKEELKHLNIISKIVTTFDDVDIQSLKLPPCTAADKGEPRLNSILIYGADTMSTKDVFEYFDDCPPESLEWVDDMSCVVVWSSESEASSVLDKSSRSLKYFVKVDPDEDSSPSEDSEMDFEDEGKQSICKKKKKRQPLTALAFGTFGSDVWRIGLPTSSNHQVYLRQATEMDKKVIGAANRSLYYLKFGKNGELSKPGSQGIISTSRKRRAQEQKEKIFEKKKELLSIDQNQMDVDEETTEVNPIKLYTVFSKGEKRLKMYSDEDDKNVFQRLTCENLENSNDTSNTPKVESGDLREKLRMKRLQKNT